jgi:hypothetical protein
LYGITTAAQVSKFKSFCQDVKNTPSRPHLHVPFNGFLINALFFEPLVSGHQISARCHQRHVIPQRAY